MSEIDVDLVNRRLAEIKQLLGELRDIVRLGLEKFLYDSYVRDAGSGFRVGMYFLHETLGIHHPHLSFHLRYH